MSLLNGIVKQNDICVTGLNPDDHLPVMQQTARLAQG